MGVSGRARTKTNLLIWSNDFSFNGRGFLTYLLLLKQIKRRRRSLFSQQWWLRHPVTVVETRTSLGLKLWWWLLPFQIFLAQALGNWIPTLGHLWSLFPTFLPEGPLLSLALEALGYSYVLVLDLPVSLWFSFLAPSSHPILTFIYSTACSYSHLDPSGNWHSTPSTLTDLSTPSTQKIFPLLPTSSDTSLSTQSYKMKTLGITLFFLDHTDHHALLVFLTPIPFGTIQVFTTSKDIGIPPSCVFLKYIYSWLLEWSNMQNWPGYSSV